MTSCSVPLAVSQIDILTDQLSLATVASYLLMLLVELVLLVTAEDKERKCGVYQMRCR